MTFLIRMGFWFSLVLLALPFDFGSGEADAPSVGPIQTFFAAKEAVSDVAGICERKPEVCATGRAAFDTITVRARESARIAIDMIETDDPRASSAPEVVSASAAPLHAAASPDMIDPVSTAGVPVPSARPLDAPHH